MPHPFHETVQTYFTDFNYHTPNGDRTVLCDMRNRDNMVGHQQRAFSVYWALKTCGPLDLGLDVGSSRGMTPYCIHVDKFGDGKPHPIYGGGAYRSDVLGDASSLSVFPSDTFPLVVSNHSLEHMPGFPGMPWTVEAQAAAGLHTALQQANDRTIVTTLRTEWLRVLRPGGILAMCIPDNDHFDVMGCDKDHKHAWGASNFEARILNHLSDLADRIEYNTLDNHFSFDVVLRKKG